MRRWWLWLFCLAAGSALADDGVLRVGSKRFTESYILGELIAQTAAPHVRTEHQQGLGNTAIVLEALKAGSIDVYAEYAGTISQEILKNPAPVPLEAMQSALAPMGLGVAVPLGFNNTYALAVRGDARGVRVLSDLAAHPELRFGLSHEFIGRADGWPGLARSYQLPQHPRGLDHGIAYEALKQKQVDVIDIYSTDAKISEYGLRVLADDRNYFPRYDAVLLYRLDAVQRFPAAWRALQGLAGRISEADMIAMNAAAELRGQPFAAIARDWLARQPPAAPGAVFATAQGTRGGAGSPAAALAGPADAAAPGAPDAALHAAGAASAVAGTPHAAPATPVSLAGRLFADDLWPLTRQHITLVALSVAIACAIGIPLGILAAFTPALRQPVLAATGVLQTIPSLALLAMLIPLLGAIGTIPALVALTVYALLPIVRNTCTGITGVPEGLRQAALALGLTKPQRLRHVDLPLAMPVILAGIKTAAIMSVGTATIAAFIGAGGYGERITTGLALNDNGLLLAGAIPAAVLALLTQALFELIERCFCKQASLSGKSL
ncbi:ABC transporter permease/substrate-binding protein [Massilia sp. SM-13]|uniref:ABC transporter permease/substrate-binding protein n=1 Tax=Pseudoduganella rhizocola TaxID=3382643 RepID=UPI0038B68C80